ncbi:hypothetical protein DRN87_01500 [Candidatus Geothermarchaeota archaeon]|nr:MAG: hypothetical protein DRN87_01500 [Candidatus Geothermarchaeota archaeon]
MELKELNLPQPIHEHLSKLGYKTLYPPQIEAFKKGILDGKNFVIATPTASGKTLIAIILILKRLYDEGYGGKYIYLVPLKALANEKYNEFKSHFDILIGERKPRISIATGDYDTSGEELKKADVIIATNEKMDSLLRHKPSWINKIKVLIIDEGHTIGYPDRGPILEGLISRVKTDLPNVQIVILSATISNIDEFAEWIRGEKVVTNWRPVPLYEGILYNHIIVYSDFKEIEIPKYYGEPIIDKIIETILDSGQVIIFTQTRSEAKRRAKQIGYYISKYLPRIYTEDQLMELTQISKVILEKGERTKLSEALADVVRFGVGFHHAGLNPQHRTIIEDSFRKGIIKVLTATPTLAAGVNLPGRVVIITYTSRRSVGGFQEDISVFEYKQMAGRAGRPQYDTYGEALIHTKYENMIDVLLDNYILNEPEPIESHLMNNEYPDVFIISIASTLRHLNDTKIANYLRNTLIYLQKDIRYINQKIKHALQRLIDGGLLELRDIRGKTYYRITPLGERTAELYIFPSTASYLWRISNEYRTYIPSDIMLLYHLSKTRDMPKLGLRRRDYRLIVNEMARRGVEEEYIINIIDNPYRELVDDEVAVWKTTLVLDDWINEATEEEILSRWGVEPGDLYVLYSTGEWLAYSAREIALIAGNKELYNRFSSLIYRLKYGVKSELVPLVQIPKIGRRRARALYNHGYKTLSTLAKARLEDLISIPRIGISTAKEILRELSKIL